METKRSFSVVLVVWIIFMLLLILLIVAMLPDVVEAQGFEQLFVPVAANNPATVICDPLWEKCPFPPFHAEDYPFPEACISEPFLLWPAQTGWCIDGQLWKDAACRIDTPNPHHLIYGQIVVDSCRTPQGPDPDLPPGYVP